MSWFLAPSLKALFADIDQVAPRRNRVSDGAKGDKAHEKRKSDHNPDPFPNGIVRAIDVTHDPGGGCDCSRLASRIRERRDPRVAYVIFNRRIMAGQAGPSPWVWRRYNGPSPHTHHMHVSIRHTEAAENDRGTWHILEEDLSIMDKKTEEFLEKQFDSIRGRIDRAVQRVGGRSNAVYNNDNENFRDLVMAEEALAKAEEARRLAKTAVDQLTQIKEHLKIS
jgi:hypothetical protein